MTQWDNTGVWKVMLMVLLAGAKAGCGLLNSHPYSTRQTQSDGAHRTAWACNVGVCPEGRKWDQGSRGAVSAPDRCSVFFRQGQGEYVECLR